MPGPDPVCTFAQLVSCMEKLHNEEEFENDEEENLTASQCFQVFFRLTLRMLKYLAVTGSNVVSTTTMTPIANLLIQLS